MNTEALSHHLEALELSLALTRYFVKQAGRLLRAKRIRPEARVYVETALNELKSVRHEGEELAHALQEMDAALHAAKLARVIPLPARSLRRRPPAKRKAPRLAGTGREENFDAQTVASARMSVNGLNLGDAAQRQEVGDAH